MRENMLGETLQRPIFEDNRDLDQYFCVEIPVRVGIIYQYKIWQKETMFMAILVKEDSDFLSYIEEDSKYNMKYYSRDLFYPHQELVTEIRDISYQERGRLKGHYLVSLEILEDAEEAKINSIFYANEYRRLSLKKH
ncbi:hypothetical protein ACFL1N_01830 [Thermodesulfobacteriota bacterium]